MLTRLSTKTDSAHSWREGILAAKGFNSATERKLFERRPMNGAHPARAKQLNFIDFQFIRWFYMISNIRTAWINHKFPF